jgi:galactoside O-acetyltransferase
VKNAPVLIRSKAWIGFNSIITKGVTIGEAAIVSCGSVVVKNVDEYSIVGGNPASKIKTNENFKDAD